MQMEEPILVVSHAEEDHSWSFVGTSGFRMEDAMLVGLEEVVKIDMTTLKLADLPRHATRESPSHPWIRSKSPPDEDEEN